MGQGLRRVPVTLSLRRLFPCASFVDCADIPVTDATDRSHECGPQFLFAAVRGTRVDGASFAEEAVQRGAAALLVETPLPGLSVPQCVVPNVRRAYAELCAALCGNPSRRMRIAGVTGTNGKTTVTWLVRAMLEQAGRTAGLLGTVEYSDGVYKERSELTTPDSRSFSRWLGRMVARGVTDAAVELSSHALVQDRTAGTELDVAVVTNVTQDHFDYHKDYPGYLSAKGRIVESCKRTGLLLLNADDAGSSSLRSRLPEGVSLLTYGLDRPADVSALIEDESLAGSRFVLEHCGRRVHVRSRLVGRHNVSNCLAAAAAAVHMGVSLEEVAAAIDCFETVPGRLERIDCGQPFDVFVDYAHTDDALRRCLQSLRQMTKHRVLCVFGAGGDRDRSKRPLLGRAGSAADIAVVTSDNPRSEDPEAIIGDILAGFRSSPCRPVVKPDRAQAIAWALSHAEPGDSILVAGKGHECEQVVGADRFPFDDRDVIRSILLAQGAAARPRPEAMPA